MVQINAYNNLTHQHIIVESCASARKTLDYSESVCAGKGGCNDNMNISVINTKKVSTVNNKQVQKIMKKYNHQIN